MRILRTLLQYGARLGAARQPCRTCSTPKYSARRPTRCSRSTTPRSPYTRKSASGRRHRRRRGKLRGHVNDWQARQQSHDRGTGLDGKVLPTCVRGGGDGRRRPGLPGRRHAHAGAEMSDRRVSIVTLWLILIAEAVLFVPDLLFGKHGLAGSRAARLGFCDARNLHVERSMPA